MKLVILFFFLVLFQYPKFFCLLGNSHIHFNHIDHVGEKQRE